MDLRKLTDEEFVALADEESKASINIGRQPNPLAFSRQTPVVAETRPEEQATLPVGSARIERKAS